MSKWHPLMYPTTGQENPLYELAKSCVTCSSTDEKEDASKKDINLTGDTNTSTSS